jgi:NADH:ubiquinone oxidoreductase subunit 3 (subunit A)
VLVDIGSRLVVVMLLLVLPLEMVLLMLLWLVDKELLLRGLLLVAVVQHMHVVAGD